MEFQLKVVLQLKAMDGFIATGRVQFLAKQERDFRNKSLTSLLEQGSVQGPLLPVFG
jgi:hypothetical protein